MSMIIRSNFKEKFISKIVSKIDTRIFNKKNLLICIDNYHKNLSFCNFVNILVNFFVNLLSILINLCFYLVFFNIFFYFPASNNIINLKPLNFLSFLDFAICNLSNILLFYPRQFVFCIIKLFINVILTDSFYLFYNLIKIE